MALDALYDSDCTSPETPDVSPLYLGRCIDDKENIDSNNFNLTPLSHRSRKSISSLPQEQMTALANLTVMDSKSSPLSFVTADCEQMEIRKSKPIKKNKSRKLSSTTTNALYGDKPHNKSRASNKSKAKINQILKEYNDILSTTMQSRDSSVYMVNSVDDFHDGFRSLMTAWNEDVKQVLYFHSVTVYNRYLFGFSLCLTISVSFLFVLQTVKSLQTSI